MIKRNIVMASALAMGLGALGLFAAPASALPLSIASQTGVSDATANNLLIDVANRHRQRVLRNSRQSSNFRRCSSRYDNCRGRYNRHYRYSRHYDRYHHHNGNLNFGLWLGYPGYYYDDPYWAYSGPLLGERVIINRGGGLWRRHVRWCLNRYRSYDPGSNTWVAYSGRVRQCVSPYY